MHRKISLFLVLLVFFISIYGAIAFYAVNPKPNQPFIGFGVFTQQGLSGYLSNSNQTVEVGNATAWHFEITNQMGSLQFVQILYRIGNTTTDAPNITSPATDLPPLSNSKLFIPDGQTAMVSFTWKVVTVSSSGSLEFLEMDVNGQEVASSVGTAPGKEFRLFFELWTFDDLEGSFQYGWRDMGSRIGSYLQVWFSVRP